MKQVVSRWCGALTLGLALTPLAWSQTEGKTVHRCPGNPVLYTDSLSAKEAREKGCRPIEGAPVTVVQSIKPRSSSGSSSGPSAAKRLENRVDPNDQRARDSESRRILEGELQRAQEQLAAAQKEYNNGEPERLGNERNYQKYIDRVADMKAALARKEGDIAAIKRELAKLPQ